MRLKVRDGLAKRPPESGDRGDLRQLSVADQIIRAVTRVVVVPIAAVTLLGTVAEVTVAETTIPENLPPDICYVVAALDTGTGDVTISWSGGTAPFTVVRANARDFREATDVEVIASDVSRGFTDRRAARSATRWWYQVFDRNSMPEIYGVTPDAAHVGEAVTVEGAGFSPNCDQNLVQFGGRDVPSTRDCSFTRLTFTIPGDSVSGYVVVVAPGGAAVADMEPRQYCDGEPRLPVSW
jgi:hypothetical protein